MSYGGFPYGGVAYAASDVAQIPQNNTQPILAVEIAFTTDPLAEPAWVDITPDVRSWSTQRGRRRELERFQPGRATIVLANRERQYDSVYDAGPWFGKLKPMKRIRIRETFNGVTYPTFDGFVDRWQLDYPGTNRDATATVTATDAMKVFARSELERSVYTLLVGDDAPVVWWRLDEDIGKFQDGYALNAGSLGPAAHGSFVASPRVGAQTLVAYDPGAAMTTESLTATHPAIQKQGVTLSNAAFSLLSNTSFAVEMWQRLALGGNALAVAWMVGLGPEQAHAIGGYTDDLGDGTTARYEFYVVASDGVTFYGVKTPNVSVQPGDIHHVVFAVESDQQMAIYLDGVRFTTSAGVSGTNLTGVTRSTDGDFHVGYDIRDANTAANNWHGDTDEVACYTGTLPSSTQFGNHWIAGTFPWAGDLPAGRIRRILSEAGWPDGPLYLPGDWAQLDDGQTSFQSAAIKGQTALEHIQKSAESEYAALVFIDRAGRVRLRDRTGVLAREPYPVTFGMEAGKIGYRAFVPDDGDDTIRNRATISRLNGVARTSQDAGSIDDFGTFQYTLDGLLMASDDTSEAHADFIVSEYKDQRRRIVSLALGPAIVGEENLVYPAMLGLELGDSIEVENLPLGGGDTFAQTCVIEGVEHQGHPGGDRSCRYALSPELQANTAQDLLLTESGDTLDTEVGVAMEVD